MGLTSLKASCLVIAAVVVAILAVSTTEAADAQCGAAGIKSQPRQVAGLFTVNDCVALYKTRPASEERTGVTKDQILLGRSSPHTGGMAQWLPTADTMQKVVDAVNQAGGVFGRKIKLVDLDNAGTPARGTDVAKQLVEQSKVFAMFGNLCVACELATYKYYAAKAVPDVFLFANGPWVAEPTVPTMFGGSTAGIGDGMVLGRYVGSQKADAKVAVVYQDDAYGQPLLEGFKVGLKQGSEKATIVRTITYNIANVADLSSQAQQAASASPDFVAFLGTAVVPLVKALRETAGYAGPVVISASGASSSNGIAAGSQNFKGVVAESALYSTDDAGEEAVGAVKAFAAKNRLVFSDYTLLGTAFTEMMVHALELAGPDLTRQGFVAAMESGFKGEWKCNLCIGPIVFGPQDHWALETVRLIQWDTAKSAFVPVPGAPLIDFETSKGRGIRGNVPGYDCKPGTCPWKK